MCKPHFVSARELRRMEQLVEECIELGHDPLAWNHHLLANLLGLVGGSVATVLKIRPDSAGLPAAVFGLDVGWASARDRTTHYEQYVATNGFRRTITFQRLTAIAGPLVTRCRAQLVPDRQWYRSQEFTETRQPLGLDDLLFSHARCPHAVGVYTITLNRRLREAPFRSRECHLLHVLLQKMLPHLGRALALPPVGVFNGLAHRLQATLRCLLDGDSEKQAAVRLGLSRFTLHEYVSDLYRHFEVSSRPELLARCYRHCELTLPPSGSCVAADLSQRLRQTLGRLLDGDSEKQVAYRLRLSRHTVHEYVTSLYRRFHVSSRAKLLVACRRGTAA
jgi:DNA-binding NarL/FixJ family response regulator